MTTSADPSSGAAEPSGPSPIGAPEARPEHDPLAELKARLDDIDAVPLEERPAFFEEVHRTLVAELSALEEV